MDTYNSSELDARLQQAADTLGVEFPSIPGGHQDCVMWQQQLLIEELIRREQAKTLERPALKNQEVIMGKKSKGKGKGGKC